MVEEAQSIEAFTHLVKHGLDIHQSLSLHYVPLMYDSTHLSIVYLARPNTIAYDRHVVEKDDGTLLCWAGC